MNNQVEKSKSPLQVVFLIIILVFISEIIVMGITYLLSPSSPWIKAFTDSLLLVILLAPSLYFFLYRPIVLNVKLRNSAENKFANLANFVELNPTPVLQLDMNGIITEANKAARIILNQDRIVSKKIADIIPGLKSLEIKNIITSGNFEYKELEIDKKNFQFTIVGVPHLKIAYIYGSDITERKLAEIDLKNSEEKFRSIFEYSIAGFYRTSPDGNILLANPALLNMLGYDSIEELQNRNLSVTGFSENSPRSKFIKILNKNDHIRDFESQWLKKDGTTIHVSENARVVCDDKGNIIYYDGVVTEITERNRSDLERHVLYEITHSATITPNLEQLLKLIHRSLNKVIDAENCFIALHNQNTGLFSFPFFVDKFDQSPEPVAMHKSCTAYVFRKGKSLLLTQKIFDQLVEQNEVELVGTNSPSWIGVPLKTLSRTIGVLVLQNYGKEDVYNERDLQLFETIGNQIALVIERKQSEEALLESEKRFRSVTQSANDTIFSINKNGKIISLNNSAETMFGYSSDELMGNSVTLLMPDTFHQAHEDGLQRFVKTKERKVIGKTVEVIGRKKDGTEIPIEISISDWIMKGELYFSGIIRDISERKQNEKEIENILHDKEERVKELHCMYSVSESIRTRNTLEELFQDVADQIPAGWHYPEITRGRVIFDGKEYFSEPFAITDWKQSCDIIIQGEIRGSIEIYYLKECPVFDEGPFLKEERRMINGIARNISEAIERKMAEEKIKMANAELNELNSTKNRLFSIISHDLRSPFHSLLNLSEIFKNEIDSLSESEISEFGEAIYQLSQQQYRLVENLLTWANFDSGKINFNPSNINLSLVVNEIMNILSTNASVKNIILLNNVDENIFINADEKMLFSLLQNLISNSIKFTNSGGSITVTSKNNIDGFYQVTVADTGIGLSNKDIDKIFSPGELYTTKGTRGENGTGLGLDLCIRIVEKHSGKFWINSVIGKGSEFNFTLPVGHPV